jgi:hypothetical protein
MKTTTRLIAGLLLLIVVPGRAVAESDPPAESGWSAFPPDLLARTYLADPLQPRFAISSLTVSESKIDDTGDRRLALRLGGRFGLVRFTPRNRSQRPWQLNIEAGFQGQFDSDHNQDNIGWDGIYGLVLVKRLSERLELKLAAKHVSSHVGDELQERTGRRRINYTREESIVGLAWRPAQSWRLYGEAARGHELRNSELQKPGRVEAGIEYQTPRALVWGLSGYAAVDLNAFEESDWDVDTTVQTGLSLPSGLRTWRAGIEFHEGRPNLGEFFQDRERWVGFGIWLDL